MHKYFKSLITAVLLLTILVIPVMAVDLCPFTPGVPSTLVPGHFIVSKQIAGSTDGTMIAQESIVNDNLLQTNVYDFSALSSGSTSYASSQALDTNSIGVIKAIQQDASNGGQALVQEQYYQGSRNLTDLTWCDQAAGGTTGSLLSGTIASQMQLNQPVDLAYSVAYGSSTGSGTAYGYGNIWSVAKSIEGDNSTALSMQEVRQSVSYTGNFQFAENYVVKISHPWASNYGTLATLVKAKGGC
jgi:hypothetical protein